MATVSALQKSGPSRNRFQIPESRKERSVLAGEDPRVRQVALDKKAILMGYFFRLSKPGRFKTKEAVLRNFLKEFNSGILWPDGAIKTIRHAGRSTIYNWIRLYKKGGLLALAPRYQTKSSSGKAAFRPLSNPRIEMRFPGQPKRNGKIGFVERIRRRYKNPPLECPVRLSIFYSMQIPRGAKMPLRMRLLRHEISHVWAPHLTALDAFVIDCLVGTVLKGPSQIVRIHSEKSFSWWPEVQVLIRPLRA